MDYKKIALFGGTFDPLHVGHLIIAEWVLEELQLDHIFFIPNFIHPFQKRADITPAQDRLEMLRLALKDFPKFETDAIEIERKSVSYTIDTIHYFKNKYPGAEIFYLIGADNLADFEQWKEPQKIKELTRLVVYNRRSAASASEQEKNVIFLDSPFIDISSTKIRQRIASGKPYRSLLPACVYDHITRHRLYEREELATKTQSHKERNLT